jgi:hypothetical protein
MRDDMPMGNPLPQLLRISSMWMMIRAAGL